MPLQKQIIEIPLRGGIDTKTNPKQLGSDKMRGLENVTFDDVGALVKRSGFTQQETSVDAKNIGIKDKQLVAVGGATGVDAYSTVQSALKTALGYFYDLSITKQRIGGSQPSLSFAGSAVQGNYRALVTSKSDDSSSTLLITDITDGTVLTELVATGYRIRNICATTNFWWIVWYDGTQVELGKFPLTSTDLATDYVSVVGISGYSSGLFDLVTYDTDKVAFIAYAAPIV